MSEEEDDDFSEVLEMIKKSSDATLMLNLITPYLIGERRGKLSKFSADLLEVIQMLVISQMKLQNDFRALLLFLNKKEMLKIDDIEVPNFISVDNQDTLYC
jgi:hypothetical protein